MKMRILELLERILEAGLSALASVGLFMMIRLLINLFWEGVMTMENELATFVASMFLVYCMTRCLLVVRYERLEIMADELEAQKGGAEDD